jgi:hypothetical protein
MNLNKFIINILSKQNILDSSFKLQIIIRSKFLRK